MRRRGRLARKRGRGSAGGGETAVGRIEWPGQQAHIGRRVDPREGRALVAVAAVDIPWRQPLAIWDPSTSW